MQRCIYTLRSSTNAGWCTLHTVSAPSRLLHSQAAAFVAAAESSAASTASAASASKSRSLPPPPPPPARLRRVVVTGLGCVTPLGCGADLLFRRLMAGETGVARMEDAAIAKLDLTPRVAAWVRRGKNEAAGEFDVQKWVPRSVLQQTSPFIHFAMAAANMALQDANYSLTPTTAAATAATPSSSTSTSPLPLPLPPGVSAEDAADRTGVCMGSGIGCVDEIADAGIALANKGKKGISAYSIPKLLVNLAAGQISIQHGFRGPNHAVATACTTGAHSIGDAFHFIRGDHADVMVAGSSEASVAALPLAMFARIKALGARTPAQQDGLSPEQAAVDDTTTSRPFDAARNGFVMGEGAGVLVLEELNHALARGARIYAEVRGYGLSGDASHITAPHAQGRGSILCMRGALKTAGLEPQHIDYINAHATSTPLGDKIEAAAIQQIFGVSSPTADVAAASPSSSSPSSSSAAALGPSVSSTKGALGHMLGAAGSVEALVCCLAVHRDQVPPSLHLQNNLEEGMAQLNYVRTGAGTQQQNRTVRAALSNSFGFGGTNASLIFTKYEE